VTPNDLETEFLLRNSVSSNTLRNSVSNNALWCDAVCRVNGAPGEFHNSIWINRHTVPPFYSNAVTLTPGSAAEQLALIRELAAERLSFSVKDSFAALDLRPLGFEVLFEATWLWRTADSGQWSVDSGQYPVYSVRRSAVSGRRSAELAWSVVAGEAELARWEAAWAGLHAGQLVPDSERIFRPALLAEPGVAFLAGSREGAIVAVAVANATVANLTGEVVGLSNVFAPEEDADDAWAGAVALASDLFPGRPLVGYERGDDLARAQAVGFEPVGELRVWVRNE
jgi:hypothetical protein